MFGAGAQPQQQSQPPTAAKTAAATAGAAATATSAEEEALKCNTDCVYFLASPLTCKKGSECEYRHSDIARVNPRDCWFWLNGNCLNPKCGFRHPPLDGLLGTQVPSPLGSALPPSLAAAAPAAHTPSISGKQGVPCIFFQKGYCLKGDRCPFLHGPSSVNNKVPQAPAATLTSEAPSLKKAFGGLDKCSQQQKDPQVNVPRSAELLSLSKPVTKVETAVPKKGDTINKTVTAPSVLGFDSSGYGTLDIPPASNGNFVGSNRVLHATVSEEHVIQNGKDTDEFSREPSPGFDVLVDDELGESDYYQNQDQFGQRGHEGRNLNLMDEYDLGRSADYNSMTDVDQEMYRDPHGYDSYDSLHGQYAWEEQHRVSSERMPVGTAHLERRRYRAESPDQIDESDLRYRLSKHRRVNGLRSVVSHDYTRERHSEDQSHQPRIESHNLTPNDGSLGNRLCGRVKVSGRSSSPVNGSERWSERDLDKGRSHARLSPGRPPATSQQGRLRDRLKARVQENFNNDGRSIRSRIRRDVNDNNANFAGPKSLAELKVGKNTESSEHFINDQQSLWKKRYKLEGHKQSEGDISFEGPKPLSEILKRKRGVETTASGSGSNQIKMKSAVTIETQSSARAGFPGHINREESKFEEGENNGAEDIPFQTDKGNSPDGPSSLQQNTGEPGTEDGVLVDDTIEDHGTEGYDQREGDYDYDQDEEDYTIVDNADPEDDYLDDDDDEFAKKMGLTDS